MDAARIAVIWTELKEYSDETQLGFPLSTIKVGELAELISENAGYRHISKRFDLLRLERDALQENVDRFLQERDAALAEVERLKGILDAGKPPRSSPFHGVTPPASD